MEHIMAHPAEPSRSDVMLSSIFMGVFIGFGYFTLYHTILESRRASRFATHVVLCWIEIFAGLVFAALTYLRIVGILKPSLGLYFVIVSSWIVQVHCLLQIIVARICVLMLPHAQRLLKLSVAILWTIVGISVYCVWIPAQLHVSQRIVIANFYWDHVEKSLYLITDAALNYYFIYTVKTRLVEHGLTKYDRLVRFNRNIVLVSLSMDCLLIGLMSFPNPLMYTSFQSVAFIVKLNIEIAMFGLIVRVAQSTGLTENELHTTTIAENRRSHRPGVAISNNNGHELAFAREWVHESDPEVDIIHKNSLNY